MRILIVASAWLSVAASVAGQTPAYPPADTSSYVIAGQVDGAPAACSPTAVADHARMFFSAMNSGAADSAARYFGRRPAAPFQWYSFSDRDTGLSFEAIESPDGLEEHFAKRHRAGNRWVLRGIEFNGWVPERNGVGFLIFFEYHLPNESGVVDRRFAFGKGELHCPSFTFVVMSLGLMEDDMWKRLYRTHVLSRRVNR